MKTTTINLKGLKRNPARPFSAEIAALGRVVNFVLNSGKKIPLLTN
jgi:hypothetical protein